MKDRLFQIWFALRCGAANREFIALLEQYGSPYNLFMAEEAEIRQMPCGDRLKQALANKDVDESYRILEYCERNGVRIVFWQDTDYPTSLRALRDPPVLLYYRGQLPDFSHSLCISVVGTRKMSEYGKRMAYKIGYELASVGTVIVSGMALGIDSVAAAGALAAGGRTVAVLGCGIDVVYPSEHATLMEEIVKNGAVITEYPPATRPEGRNFPVRNRIISGLGQGTVIVEADQKSGALITAKTAILQGRDIYAIPGNVGDENASGTNQLIRDGAAVVLRARDILENYTFLYRDTIRMGLLAEAESSSEPNDAVFERLRVYARTVGEGRSSPSTTTKRGHVDTRSAPRPTPRPEPTAHDHPNRSSLRGGVAGDVSGDVSRDRQDIPARSAAPFAGDRSSEALQSLSETQRNIFAALPLDRAVTVDYLTREGFSMSDIMAAMTILEIKGLVVTLPGGLYSRK